MNKKLYLSWLSHSIYIYIVFFFNFKKGKYLIICSLYHRNYLKWEPNEKKCTETILTIYSTFVVHLQLVVINTFSFSLWLSHMTMLTSNRKIVKWFILIGGSWVINVVIGIKLVVVIVVVTTGTRYCLLIPWWPMMGKEERKVPVATHKRPTYTHINSSTLTHSQSCTAYTMRDIYHTMQTYRQIKK